MLFLVEFKYVKIGLLDFNNGLIEIFIISLV